MVTVALVFPPPTEFRPPYLCRKCLVATMNICLLPPLCSAWNGIHNYCCPYVGVPLDAFHRIRVFGKMVHVSAGQMAMVAVYGCTYNHVDMDAVDLDDEFYGGFVCPRRDYMLTGLWSWTWYGVAEMRKNDKA